MAMLCVHETSGPKHLDSSKDWRLLGDILYIYHLNRLISRNGCATMTKA